MQNQGNNPANTRQITGFLPSTGAAEATFEFLASDLPAALWKPEGATEYEVMPDSLVQRIREYYSKQINRGVKPRAAHRATLKKFKLKESWSL